MRISDWSSDVCSSDLALLGKAAGLLEALRTAMRTQTFHTGLGAIWEVVGEANRYVDAQAPWTLRKKDPARMADVLYVLAETSRRIALLVKPFMPGSAARILDQLPVGQGDARQFAAHAPIGRVHALTPE